MAEIYRSDIVRVDLDHALLRKHVGAILVTGDKLGNRFGAEIFRDGNPVDVTGCGVTAYFMRPGEDAIVLNGTASGSVAYVDLAQACYSKASSFTLTIKISYGGATTALRVIDGYILLTQTDDLVDPGDVVPTLDDLLAQIEAMEQGTAAARNVVAEYEGKVAEQDASIAALTEDIVSLSTVVPMEQGTISGGYPVDAANRIRTAGFVHGKGTITLSATDFRITYINYYHPDTLKVVFSEVPDARTATMNHPGYLAKIIVTRYDRTSNLTPADVQVMLAETGANEAYTGILKMAGGQLGYDIPLEQGGISGGYPIAHANRVRSKYYLPGNIVLDTGDQYTHVFTVNVYDANGVFQPDLGSSPYSSHVELNLGDDYYVLPTFAKRTANDGSYNIAVNPSTVSVIGKTEGRILWVNNQLAKHAKEAHADIALLKDAHYNIPTAKFDPDYTLRDYESVDMSFADVPFINETQTACEVMPRLYALFDQLVAKYPQYVSKVDVGAEYGLTYPEYANGVSGSDKYLDTPAYKTYMYTLRNPIPNIGTEGRHPYQRALLVGGTHGNEYASPYNLYQLARDLCENYLDDPNLFKLRSSFQIHIIPVLNGYGAYHRRRGNANNIDINRNFPCEGWTPGRGVETMYDPGRCGYSGEVAGSEFETKIVMEATRIIRPHIAIDCHNYSAGELHQFYTIMPRERQLRFAYQATTEIAYVLKKHYPEYFGTGFGVLQELPANAPYTTLEKGGGYISNYWDEQKVPICCTLEVSQCINYNNGVADGTPSIDNFGPTAFTIAEYTLRNQFLRYCQFILDNAPEMDFYWNKPHYWEN